MQEKYAKHEKKKKRKRKKKRKEGCLFSKKKISTITLKFWHGELIEYASITTWLKLFIAIAQIALDIEILSMSGISHYQFTIHIDK